MAAVSTIIVGAAALGALGYGVHAGEQQQRAQRQAMRRQERVQEEAKAAAVSQQRRSLLAERAANQQAPDMSSLLAFESGTGAGAASMLSGGVSRSKLPLNRPTLLGDV